jgi:lysophospholipase L1-like esterase
MYNLKARTDPFIKTMKSLQKSFFFLIGLAALLGFTHSPEKITVYLIGDSTIAQKAVSAYPETGWGMPFVYFFDESVTVDNRAMNGRSTRSFIEENRWQPVATKLQKGDYVFIQFGHNDEVPTKKSYTNEVDFQANLSRFITETRAKNANPVLLTPVARRQFDASGKVVGTHDAYSELVRTVAQKEGVPLIDLDRSSQELLQKLGPEASKLLFMQLAPGEHPNYPGGKDDNTHFSETGARKMAELVLAEIKAQRLELSERIVKKK